MSPVNGDGHEQSNYLFEIKTNTRNYQATAPLSNEREYLRNKNQRLKSYFQVDAISLYNESSDIKQMSEERKQRSAVQHTNTNQHETRGIATTEQDNYVKTMPCK